MLSMKRTIESAWTRHSPSADGGIAAAGHDGATERAVAFDAIRLFAAFLVVFSHSFEITQGDRSGEPLVALFGQLSLGEVGVLIFFAVSGFLVTESWRSTPHANCFLWKRGLRIVPALWVNVLILALVVGPVASTLAPAAYFSDPGTASFLVNGLMFGAEWGLPGVFTSAPVANAVNLPLWTLSYEILCYLMIAILGAANRLRPGVLAVIFAALLTLNLFPEMRGASGVGGLLYPLTLVGPSFLAGAIASCLAPSIRLARSTAIGAAITLWIAAMFGSFTVMFAISGVYLVLYFALSPPGWLQGVGRRLSRFGDYSYGVYLWGWPVQQMIETQLQTGSWALNFAISAPITLLLAIASWRIVEKPALRLKRLVTSRRSQENLGGDVGAVSLRG